MNFITVDSEFTEMLNRIIELTYDKTIKWEKGEAFSDYKYYTKWLIYTFEIKKEKEYMFLYIGKDKKRLRITFKFNQNPKNFINQLVIAIESQHNGFNLKELILEVLN